MGLNLGLSRFPKRTLYFFVIFVISIGFANAFLFNGTVYDINGNPLANATINITSRSTTDFTIAAYNSTTTNESGWFNITLPNVATWIYDPQIAHSNTSLPTRNYTDYIGQSLPSFPSFVFDAIGGTSFFLRESGSFNLTAINSTGQRIAFNYQVKDVLLGYPIAESFDFASGGVREANLIVPADRNYSIMIYPNQSLPVSFEWNNFTSRATYNLTTPSSGNNLSHYNGTTRTVHKQFNITLSLPRVNGTANFTTAIRVSGLDNFTIVAYLMESNNMVHATYGGMPYNLSFFGGGTDVFLTNNGTYNMTLPASAETTKYILFASGRNGTNYLGAFANLTIQYGAAPVNIDFTMRGLLGNLSYIGLDNAADFSSKKLIATAKQSFQFVNKTNSSLSQAFAHIEITVNYSEWGMHEFTWVEDVPQSGNGNFSIPMLNTTGIKEMNIFIGGGNYAPRRVAPRVDQILTGRHVQGGGNLNLSMYNITINTFNAGDIEGQMAASNITMALYKSNATCDAPSPGAGCLLGGSQNMSNFNPMGAIIGGGKLSFRMGTGNITVHYVNVDMLASGPPEALFDDSSTDKTSGSTFDQAVRFGSGGPTIYDFVLVSIPYSDAAGTGLNDAADINMTLPLMYDDDWKVLWNTTANGTAASSLAGNFTHYIAKQSEWNYLLGQTNCTTNAAEFNVSRPCYVDKAGNVVWIRLPHFSGTGPSIVGSVVAAATPSSSSGGSGGGGGALTTTVWKETFTISTAQLKQGYTANLAANARVKMTIGAAEHHVGVLSLTATNAKIQIASTPQEATLNIGETKKFEVTGDGFYDIQVTLNSITEGKATIKVASIFETIPKAESSPGASNVAESPPEEAPSEQTAETNIKENKSVLWIWIAVIVALVVIIIVYTIAKQNSVRKHVLTK